MYKKVSIEAQKGEIMEQEYVYVSTDVEADGKIPGKHSMLSFGSAAYTPEKTLVATFTANLHVLPGAVPDEKVMEWWKTEPGAWEECRRNQEDPAAVMLRYVNWFKELPGKPVFLSFPLAYDFMFMFWYCIYFTGESPFGHRALDVRSFAMGVLRRQYGETRKEKLPREWFDQLPHTHRALDDAIAQGALFCNILKASGVLE